MKVKMLTRSAGPSGTIRPGAVIEVPTTEGKLLITAGYAEAVEAVVETDRAAKPKQQAKRQTPTKPRTKKATEVTKKDN